MKRGKKNPPDSGKAANPSGKPITGGTGFAPGIRTLVSRKAFIAPFLFLVSFAVFIPSLDNDFIWDDVTFIVESAPYLETAGIGLGSFKIYSESSVKYFRPLFTVSLITDYRMWGLSPFGYHLTNIILHSVCTVLLYFLILLLCSEFKVEGRGSVAFIASLLFALYPLHVETVSFISARADIVACILLILCLTFYVLSYRKLAFLLPAVFFLYMSLFSKEVAYSFPVLIVGFDLITRRFLSRVNLVKYLVLLILVLAYVYLRSSTFLSLDELMAKSSLRETEGVETVSEFLVLFLGSYLFYAQKLVFPYSLNHFIGTIPGGDALHITISVLLVAAVAAVFVISVKKRENITAYSLLWIFATLGPAVMIAIFPIAITRFAERFTYIPSAGFCMLLGYVVVAAGRRSGIKWAGWAVAGVLCVSYLAVTVKGQGPWQDSLTFWRIAVEKSPDQLAPKVNYGEALKNAGRHKEARAQYREALGALNSDGRGKAMAEIPLAASYIQKGEYDKAEEVLESAIRNNPGAAADYNYLMGYIYLQKNQTAAAKKYLEESLSIRSWKANPNFVLGSIYYSEAVAEDSPEKYGLAEKYLKKAVRVDPGMSRARILLARVYIATGRREEAVTQAKQALNDTNNITVIKEAKSIIAGD